MSITKYIDMSFEVESIFTPDAAGKYASIQIKIEPERYVPPEIAAYLAELQPNPAYLYVHVIAMADRCWGANINADIFRAEELLALQTQVETLRNPGAFRGVPVPRYKTFEFAKLFRMHRNRPEKGDPVFGFVPCAGWNEPMRRVHLVIAIDREAAPDMVIEVENGRFDVSMGCKIGSEVCSICGHEHADLKDRCFCLKNQLGAILPDGRQVCADNLKPFFYDISDVNDSIPAEPTAQMIGKVAFVNGKQLKVSFAFEDGGDLCRSKLAELDKNFPSSGSLQEASGGVDLENTMAADHAPVAFSDEDLSQFLALADGDISALVSALSLLGVTLSPGELQSLTLQAGHGAAPVVPDLGSSAAVSTGQALTPALGKIAYRSAWQNPPWVGDIWETNDSATQQAAADPDAVAQYQLYRLVIASTPASVFETATRKLAASRHPSCGGDASPILGGSYDSVVTGLVHAGLGLAGTTLS